MQPPAFIAAFLLAASNTVAQVVPFTFDGVLEGIQATNLSQFNTGGSIQVFGTTITIPQNLLVQFPATFVPFQEFAQTASQSLGFEVFVDGNYVNEVPIAGTVFVSQLIGAAGAGIVDKVNNDGTMKISGGPLLRINTPNGVYATAYTSRPHFTADEENPSISSFSGFPMCIPRSAGDPLCPANNRAANGARVYTPTNTSAMVPFIPGDYVTWGGVTNGGNEILCYSIVAENVQPLTTGSSGDPVYVRVEDVVIGVNNADPNTEVATTKFTGYLSDGTASVTIYRLDVDPCTGAESETQVASGNLKAGDVRNKFDIRITDTAVTKTAQQYRVKANKGAKVVANGLQAGQYTSPITELIWPENNVPGTPWSPNPFEIFSNLKDGFVMDNMQWGQLKPWPGSPVPAPAKICTGNELNSTGAPPPPTGESPVASAGPDLTGQLAGSLITITGKNTNPNLANNQLTFAWTGPTGVTINNADQPAMNFVNPWQDPTTTPTSSKTFTLKICLVASASTCNSSSVKVTTDKFVDKITITGYQFATKQGGTITVSATSNNVLTGTNGANLQLQLSGAGAWIPMVQDTSNPGTYTYTARSVGKQPTNIGVRSSHNTTPVTTSVFVKRSARDWKRYSR